MNHSDKPTVVVCDTWGLEPHQKLARAYPQVEWVVLDRAPAPNHAHGHMCAELICKMANKSGLPFRVVFDPWLAANAENPVGWVQNLRRVSDLFPQSKILANNSWGAHHHKNRFMESNLSRFWSDSNRLAEVRHALEEVDAEVMFAAGNQDGQFPGRSDEMNDVCYPQRALAQLDRVAVIGSNDPAGVPSYFSADGPEVMCMYPGQRIRVLDPNTNRITAVDGTSFATPLALGDLLHNWLTDESVRHEIGTKGLTPWFKQYVLDNSSTAMGWPRGVQHPKGGFGSMNRVVRRRLTDSPLLAAPNTELGMYEYQTLARAQKRVGRR